MGLGVHDAPDDAEQVEGRARQAVNPGHDHLVSLLEASEESVQFPAVGTGTAGLFLEDAAASGRRKLFQLRIKRLSDRRDTRISHQCGAS